jgi:hypothetical protein
MVVYSDQTAAATVATLGLFIGIMVRRERRARRVQPTERALAARTHDV